MKKTEVKYFNTIDEIKIKEFLDLWYSKYPELEMVQTSVNNGLLVTLIYTKLDDFNKDDFTLLKEFVTKVCNEELSISINSLQAEALIGYNRAYRLITYLEEQGIVNPKDGKKPRTMKVSLEEALNILNKNQ